MKFSQEIKNEVLALLESGVTYQEIITNSKYPKTIKTLKDWQEKAKIAKETNNNVIKHKANEYQEEPKENEKKLVKEYKTPKTKGREEWNVTDYSGEEQLSGYKALEKERGFWNGIKLPKGYIFNPKRIDFIESKAREEFHGTSFEDRLHLGIYQIKKEKTDQVRKKKLDILLSLTSQNHIFPDKEIKDKDNSYHPENVREGHALFNCLIGKKIDPIFCKNGKELSDSTINMLIKYNLIKDKPIKEHISFKYVNERIVTTNMIIELPQAPKGSFEAPEVGILDGSKKAISLKVYSVLLYKIETSVGIVDVGGRNIELLKIFWNKCPRANSKIQTNKKEELIAVDNKKEEALIFNSEDLMTKQNLDEVAYIGDLFSDNLL